jgi:hypothetical protein
MMFQQNGHRSGGGISDYCPSGSSIENLVVGFSRPAAKFYLPDAPFILRGSHLS